MTTAIFIIWKRVTTNWFLNFIRLIYFFSQKLMIWYFFANVLDRSSDIRSDIFSHCRLSRNVAVFCCISCYFKGQQYMMVTKRFCRLNAVCVSLGAEENALERLTPLKRKIRCILDCILRYQSWIWLFNILS